jgi:uncharacterized protein (TIGR02646 family)
MKKLDFPNFDRLIVKKFRSKVIDTATAQAHWNRNYGLYRAFKANITSTMKVAQSNRCAYCGTRLHEERPHRDHIAPKSPYYQWTFWPINLVLACYCCNVDCKGEDDTVDVLAPTYRRTTFKIVHPFLDDPADHLEFGLDDKSILINAKNGSAKGAATIEMFNLMEPERAKERAKDLLLDDDVEHLLGLTRDLFLAAMEEMGSHRLLMRPTR